MRVKKVYKWEMQSFALVVISGCSVPPTVDVGFRGFICCPHCPVVPQFLRVGQADCRTCSAIEWLHRGGEKSRLVRRVDEVRPWTDGRNQRSSGVRSSWEHRALDRNRVACAGIYDCQERSPTGRFWIILGRPSDRPAYLTPLLRPRRVLRSTSPMERPGFRRA